MCHQWNMGSLPRIYRAHCLSKLCFDISKPHSPTIMSVSSFLAIFPLRPEFTQGDFFWLKMQKKRKIWSLDQQFLLSNLSIQSAWSISHYRFNHFFFKKMMNSANPLDKYTQEYQYTKIYEKQDDYFRISFFQSNQCLPAFFLLIKVRTLQLKVDSGWCFFLKINHYLTFITSQNPFSINRWTKLFLKTS